MVALLLACSGQGQAIDDAGAVAEAYAPVAGAVFEFVPPDNPETPPLMLRVGEELGWELRRGERWADAEAIGSFEVSEEGGFWVGDELLLPERLQEGEVFDEEGLTVGELGQVEVWYGAFPQAVRVERSSGSFASEQIFAQDIGPIALTLSGFRWELAWYD